jgi:hypothetical protein
MRATIAIVFAAALLALSVASAQERAATPATVVTPKLSPATVPPGRTYVQLDAGGKRLGEFLAGQTTPMSTTDCAQVDCPSTFDKNVVCWKCKERIKAK